MRDTKKNYEELTPQERMKTDFAVYDEHQKTIQKLIIERFTKKILNKSFSYCNSSMESWNVRRDIKVLLLDFFQQMTRISSSGELK